MQQQTSAERLDGAQTYPTAASAYSLSRPLLGSHRQHRRRLQRPRTQPTLAASTTSYTQWRTAAQLPLPHRLRPLSTTSPRLPPPAPITPRPSLALRRSRTARRRPALSSQPLAVACPFASAFPLHRLVRHPQRSAREWPPPHPTSTVASRRTTGWLPSSPSQRRCHQPSPRPLCPSDLCLPSALHY